MCKLIAIIEQTEPTPILRATAAHNGDIYQQTVPLDGGYPDALDRLATWMELLGAGVAFKPMGRVL